MRSSKLSFLVHDQIINLAKWQKTFSDSFMDFKMSELYKESQKLLEERSLEYDISTDDIPAYEYPHDEVRGVIDEAVKQYETEEGAGEKESTKREDGSRKRVGVESIREFASKIDVPIYEELFGRRSEFLTSYSRRLLKGPGKRIEREKEQAMLEKLAEIDKMEENPESESSNLDENEIVVKISFYKSNRRKPVQSVLCLGSNTLNMLEKKIKCVLKHSPVSQETDSQDNVEFASIPVKSGSGTFFFIENTFYCAEDSIQNASHIVIEAHRKNVQSLNSFEQHRTIDKKAKRDDYSVVYMNRTKISALRVRIGAPYLFVHNSTCEHIFCVDEVALANVRYPRSKEVYPLVIDGYEDVGIKCFACKRNLSTLLVIGSELLKTSPYAMCNECFEIFFYDSQGNCISPHIKTVSLI